MAGYVFIGNSSKPSMEKNNSREPVKPGNVSIPCIEAALNLGYEVYLGTNRYKPEELECSYPVHLYDSHTYRSITAFSDNMVAFRNLSNVVKKGNIEVIHCNTPVGGMIGRLVGRKYHVKKVIYTAHGFHFYKGAPLFNRTVLKWAEQLMARWTDAIITMNQEDYEAAKKFKLKKDGKIFLVHGVGITLSEFVNPQNREEKRNELGLKPDEIALISAGDLVARKNYRVAIEAIAKANDPRLHYFICGRGPELENLKKLAEEKKVLNNIHFLGFRNDVKELFFAADIFLFTSLQEGLPRSMMEAMACGLPCIASSIRGNVDLLENGVGGYLNSVNDIDGFAKSIITIANDYEVRKKMMKNNLNRIKNYDVEIVKKEIEKIYKEVIG